MHELSVANNIIDLVTEARQINKSDKIISVRLLIGPLSGIDPDSLEFCFTEASKGTQLDGTLLIMERSPLIIRCLRCKKESEVNVDNCLCRHCQHFDVIIVSGKEFNIIDLEVIQCVETVAAKKEINAPTLAF
jgi:hydrogenase nickel incorporation protein HypA/HybF